MKEADKIIIVVVTYNRMSVLKRCLFSLLAQSQLPDSIIIVDNASTDGTKEMLQKEFPNHPLFAYVNLGTNLGGAGGFHFGAKLAIEKGADWVCLMDDDCLPHKDCLKKLMMNINDKKNIYSPIVLSIEDKKTALWGIKARVNTGNREVVTLPFNGFLIHRESIKELDFPEKDFFIYGDDTEYNLRAKSSGRKIIMVTDSVMYHPYRNMLKGLNILKMFKSKIWVYYKLRNAIVIYKKYKYVSINQILMFLFSLLFYILTLKLQFINLWFEGLKDGLKNRIYVRDF
jgi:rhamnopyranosyl-N-acetylglucosaminyl-diphospho-decaprenol beta-1,3/1,4-galactofuranosyltransferase